MVPTQLGFDPRLQFLHADDAHGALEAATADPGPRPGQRRPVGTISLSHILRLVRRPALPIPHPLFGPALEPAGHAPGAGRLYGDGVRLLRFGRGVDNRRLRDELGYEPRFDAEGAIRDFVGEVSRPPGRARPASGAIAPDGSPRALR